jgi:hypothetical protein
VNLLNRIKHVVLATACFGFIGFPMAAMAGCGDANGQAIICLKGTCKYHKVIRECSSAQEGSFYQFEDKTGIGWSADGNMRYIEQKDGGRLTYNESNWPYKVKLCGDSRGFPNLCSNPKWKINFLR